jgi:hypothetical protein
LYDIADIRDIEFDPVADFVLFQSYDRLQVYGLQVVDNSPHMFPELRFNTLKSHAIEWAQKWPVIQNVKLFRYSPLVNNPNLLNKRVKYALLFDVGGDEAEIQRFKSEIDCNQIPDGHIHNIFYKTLMPPAFESVYKQRPPQDYQLEWIIVTTERIPAQRYFDTNFSWLLYDRYTETSSVFPGLITNQEQEINRSLQHPTSTRALSEFEKGLIKFVKIKRKKSPGITIPYLAMLALRADDDFLYTLKKGKQKPKKETIEKYIRKLDKEQN